MAISNKDYKLCSFSFLPGVVAEQPLSTSPVKRRTQSLSALPKDGDKNSPGKVGTPILLFFNSIKHLCSRKRRLTFSNTLYALSEGEGPHPKADECVYDLQ